MKNARKQPKLGGGSPQEEDSCHVLYMTGRVFVMVQLVPGRVEASRRRSSDRRNWERRDTKRDAGGDPFGGWVWAWVCWHGLPLVQRATGGRRPCESCPVSEAAPAGWEGQWHCTAGWAGF